MKGKIFRVLFICIGGLMMGCNRGEEKLTSLSEKARIYILRDFLSEKECEHLIALGEPTLKPSTVVDDHIVNGRLDQARRSRGTFLTNHGHDPIVVDIENRIAELTHTPKENGESFQILHYQPGGEYKPHYDTFDPETVGGKNCFDRGGQRVATVILYLNSTEVGGETIFPNVDIAVTPKKGDAVLFYNLSEEGQIDKNSLHGGAPVLKGEKWIATKWIREGEFR
ncbi:MAG: 2OG-Fe(II) oxygenase [Simkaniaceae bacterium]